MKRTGRPRLYCSTGCRRAVEYEIRRVVRGIDKAEQTLARLRRRADGVEYNPYRPEGLRKAHDWWAAELARLEERLRLLLDDTTRVPAGTVTPIDPR